MGTAKLTFWGAAGQVTGSMHLLEAAGARILLDARVFQGHRAEAAALNANLPFDPRRIDAIVVSHAHLDHIGRLPLLVRHGYHGAIYATPATRDLCAVMLPDAAHIQESDAAYLAKRGKKGPESEPLYNLADALAVQELIVGLPYRRIHYLRKNLAFEYTDAGHILGSASVDLRLTQGAPQRIAFSGDIRRAGAADHPRPRAPQRPDRHADRRVHLRRSRPRIGDRLRGAPRRGRPESRGPRREGADPLLCPGPDPGDRLRPARALRREEDPRHHDLRGQPPRGGRHGGVPVASRGLRPAGAAPRQFGSRLRLPPGAIRPLGRGVQEAQHHERPRGDHRRVGDGRGGPYPPPPRQPHRRSEELRPLRRVPGRKHPRPPHPGGGEAGEDLRRAPRRTGRSADDQRLLRPRRPHRAPRLGATARRTDPAGVRGARRARARRGDGPDSHGRGRTRRRGPHAGRVVRSVIWPRTRPYPARLRSFLGRWGPPLVVLALLGYALLFAWVWWGSRLDQLEPADAIVVLGAAQYNGRPSPVLKARLDHALELYRRGLAPTIVVTGGIGPGDRMSEATVGDRYLRARGVPDSAIVVRPDGRTTEESMRSVADWIADREADRVLLVSDPFHMARLQLEARRAPRAPDPEK